MEDKCEICKKVMKKRVSWQKTCGRKCRKIFVERNQKKYQKKYRNDNKRGLG
jgi:hypothetical protein